MQPQETNTGPMLLVLDSTKRKGYFGLTNESQVVVKLL